MRILAIERELMTIYRPDLHDILRVEAAAVWDLQRHDIIRDIWFTPTRRAIILMECTGAVEARTHLATLPLVHQGMSEFEVMELSAYDGYERLFAAGLARPLAPAEPPEY